MRRSIVATDAVLRAAAKGPTATVTVVPVLPGREAGTEGGLKDILTIDGVSISAVADADDAGVAVPAVPPEAGSSQDDVQREQGWQTP
jgi:hypothetical protein